ncbi:DUF983 domain-containing protein [Mesorhizobium sp. VK25A]|uniref:DUF983 domain-containing protein n=1 Tax=Mesorhizobium vachelliae TaxID=3072309 RepID=A0ABU5AEF9_9HYPH|nr:MULTISPECIES: DUF983 domain-containing protein [unclassified Mesorhizobium]MDX8535659.1 DUF983 domain-containing protein [Mesorhizobium sp. VK25D]MDX8548324.1 DUF983 domain-containing protein [Mesorhizobium sp. VK25A]
MEDHAHYPPLVPWQVGIRGRCPRCGEGHLFEGFLKLAPKCDVCGLDFSFADPADGPAFFVICFACVPSVLFAVWAQVTFEPSMWFHAFVSIPIVLASCIPPLRPLKGWLVASQFYHKAEEGRLARPGE